MPIYEYHCPACNDEFELLIRAAETPACPACGSVKLEKLLSVPAAPSLGSQSLPIAGADPGGGCGLPQCGQGRCGME